MPSEQIQKAIATLTAFRKTHTDYIEWYDEKPERQSAKVVGLTNKDVVGDRAHHVTVVEQYDDVIELLKDLGEMAEILDHNAKVDAATSAPAPPR